MWCWAKFCSFEVHNVAVMEILRVLVFGRSDGSPAEVESVFFPAVILSVAKNPGVLNATRRFSSFLAWVSLARKSESVFLGPVSGILRYAQDDRWRVCLRNGKTLCLIS